MSKAQPRHLDPYPRLSEFGIKIAEKVITDDLSDERKGPPEVPYEIVCYVFDLKDRIAALECELSETRAEIARLNRELDNATYWNESVAVCKNHTEDICRGKGLPNHCWVCGYTETMPYPSEEEDNHNE
jgi:hypothetical protein